MTCTARAAQIGDAAAIAKIYNEGIADRIATFGYPRVTVSWIAVQWRARFCRDETNCFSGVSLS